MDDAKFFLWFVNITLTSTALERDMRDRLHVDYLIAAVGKVWENMGGGDFNEFLVDISYFAHQPVVRMSINSYPDDMEGETYMRDMFTRSWTDPEDGYDPYVSWEMEVKHAHVLWEYRKMVGRDNWWKIKAG